MSEQTGIAWTDHTFNPWWGCVKVSPACASCYAERDSKRYGFKVWGADAERRFFGDKHWHQPVQWDAHAARLGIRKRVFCASMADVFEDYPTDAIGVQLDTTRNRLWELIAATPHLDWLLLTKRPENIRIMYEPHWLTNPPKNVWLGTTVETQAYERRVSDLLQVPAVVHFVSAEPLLDQLDCTFYTEVGPLSWLHRHSLMDDVLTQRVGWVIAGGESGPNCRLSKPDWFRHLRDQCVTAGVPFFFKQWGGLRPKDNGNELDGKKWEQFPEVSR